MSSLLAHTEWLLLSLPFLVILLAMVVLKWSALSAGVVALLVTVSVIPFQQNIPMPMLFTEIIPGSLLEASTTAASILWIIFGALCIYYAQINSGAIAHIQQWLARLHPNPKVSAFFIAWFFSLFMEGAAGFGTSAALTAPFLVAAGYRPVMAVVLALWGHSLGVAFGAVGTPVITQALLIGETELTLARAVLPFLVPTTVVLALGLAWGCMRYGPAQQPVNDAGGFAAEHTADNQLATVVTIIKLGILAAVCFLLPAVLAGYFLGPELPTLLGSALGAVLFVLVIAPKAFTAKSTAVAAPPQSSLLVALAPYLVLIALVLITRLTPDIKAFLQGFNWRFEWRYFQSTFHYAYHPGTLLLFSFIIGSLIQRQGRTIVMAAQLALQQVIKVFAALLVMLLIARLLVHTGAIHQLGYIAAQAAGNSWPFWVTWFGVLGTFITGSATSSNILFSEFQRSAALAAGHSPIPMLGAQTVGAAIGNMVCPHNIIAAGATVNLAGSEGQVMRYTLPMAALLTGLAGLIALLY